MQPSMLNSRLMGRSQPDMLEAARVAALLNSQSGTFNLQSGLGGAGLVGGSLSGLGAAPSGLNLSLSSLPSASQQQQLDQLALLSQFPASLLPQYNSTEQLGNLRNVGKTRSSDSRSSSAYASRHQAAEQRRRTRINERLELLRKLVPHAERANTAVFLEEVIKYIEALKCRTLELEAALEAATGKPVTKSAPAPSAATPIEPAESQDPSPRPASTGAPSKRQSGQSAAHATGAGTSPTPPPAGQLASLPSAGSDQDALQELPPSAQAGPQQQHADLLDPPPQLQLPPLQGSAAAQLSQLQQAQAAALGFPHAAGSLALAGSHLSLGGGGGGGGGSAHLTLSQLAAGLQGPSSHGLSHGLSQHAAHSLLSSSHHHHGGSHSGSLHGGSGHHHSASHHHSSVAAQLSELQKLQAMHSLQQHSSRPAAAAPPPAFHPVNNKAFLHFNEDLFGGLKPELGLSSGRGGLGGAGAGPTASAGTTATHSLQLTSLQLPSDSNTNTGTGTGTLLGGLGAAEAGRRERPSGSPVSSEESGVPLKKRKVLML